MLQHARDNCHHFRKEDVTVLCSKSDWTKRGIKEAIYIHTLKPSINIDPGRHTLSTHFDSLLTNIVKKPASPTPHNAEAEALINTAPRRQGRPRKDKNATAVKESTAPVRPQPARQSQRIINRQQQQQL